MRILIARYAFREYLTSVIMSGVLNKNKNFALDKATTAAKTTTQFPYKLIAPTKIRTSRWIRKIKRIEKSNQREE
jgi:hypothetical protein